MVRGYFTILTLGWFLLLLSCSSEESDNSADGDAVEKDKEIQMDRWDFPVDHPLRSKGFLNIAHRGGGLLAPEESLEAYRNAVAAGADMLEMDLHASRDGVLVLHHDATVDRITDGTGAIKEMSFEDLRKLDAGFSFSPDNGLSYPYRGKGVQVASFREVLQEFPTAIFSAEIKQSDPPIVDAVLAILKETGMENRVILVSFVDAVMREIREKNPSLVTGASLGEMMVFTTLSAEKAKNYEPPCPIFQLSGINAEQLALAHSLDMAVQIWTVNEAEAMRRWLDLGVDAVMTDDPALLEGILEEKGLR